jgi:hypothetical protein
MAFVQVVTAYRRPLPHDIGDGGERLFIWMSAGPKVNRVNEWFAPPNASRVVIEEWLTDCGAPAQHRSSVAR